MNPANLETRSRYDDLPYSSYAYLHSAPEHLAAVAAMFGLPSPDVGTARVLELGSASGGNLIPFALRHPGAKVVGVDLSGVQVAAGKARIGQLGLDNVELIEADLLDLDAKALGEFDYIIAHGLYSWAPPQVQDAVLAIIGACLSPAGVAFVSYNTYPGWKQKEILRDAMLMHGGERPIASEQVAYGRAMLDFLARVAPKGGLVSAALDDSMALVMQSPLDYVAHEFFSPHHQPCYFHQFVQHSAGHGLAYLGEALPATMLPSNYGRDLAQQIHAALGDDQIRIEQYLDIAIGRSFRQTLLVRVERAQDMRWQIDHAALGGMHFAAKLTPADGVIRLDGQRQEFIGEISQAGAGPTISTSLPALKQAITLLLEAWPGTVTREELIRHAETTQDGPGVLPSSEIGRAVDELIELLLVRGILRIRQQSVEVAGESSRLEVDATVRSQLTALPSAERYVANAWHDVVEVTDDERALLLLLDGSLDRTALVSAVAEALNHGRLSAFAADASRADARAEETTSRLLARWREQAVLLR